MDRFDVERSYVMKKYLSIKGVLITTNIPEKAYITSGTFHHPYTKRQCYTLLALPCSTFLLAPRFWVPRDQPKPGYFLEGGRERSLGTRLCWDIKKNYYSNVNQFRRKICKGSLEIFLFMQITDFLADLCCILAVFKYKYLKIAAT